MFLRVLWILNRHRRFAEFIGIDADLKIAVRTEFISRGDRNARKRDRPIQQEYMFSVVTDLHPVGRCGAGNAVGILPGRVGQCLAARERGQRYG